MHLDDVVERRPRVKNELIIASHFSTRYSGKRIREVVERSIPDMFDGRLQLWI
jgi:ribonuclease Z